MPQRRTSIKNAIRSVVEQLEQRKLLTAVSSTTFTYEAHDQHLDVLLSGPGAAQLQASDLAVRNLSTDTATPFTRSAVSADDRAATFKPSAIGPLANGWYESYVTSPALEPSATDNEQTFSFLNADFDANGVTDFVDFSTLQNNFSLTPATFAQGDANYDGVVDFSDYLVVQNNYGLSLPALPTEPGQLTVGHSTQGVLDVGWVPTSDPRDGFKIYRSTDGINFTLADTVDNPDARSWPDTSGLAYDVKYWYRVRSYTNAAGASAAVTKAWGLLTRPAPIAVATPNPVTGTTAQLSVLGGPDPATSTYAWTEVSGPATATFSGTPDTNAAQTTTATFTEAGAYTFAVSVTDASGTTVVSDPLAVEVVQTVASVEIMPSDVTLPLNASMDFTAYVTDQFGQPVIDPVVAWQLVSGPGTLTGSTYTAAGTPGAAVIRATSGTVSGTTAVAVENSPPIISGQDYYSTSGTTAVLSILGTDDAGESNLVYTWTIDAKPDGAVDPEFSEYSSNFVHQTTAAFNKAGLYEFTVSADDGEQSTSLSITVFVASSATTMSIESASPYFVTGVPTHLTATATDQFGDPIDNPDVTWSSAYGTFITPGDYVTNNLSSSTDQVTATCGIVQRTFTISRRPDPLLLQFSQANPVSGLLQWNDPPDVNDTYTVYESINGTDYHAIKAGLINETKLGVDADALWAEFSRPAQVSTFYLRVARTVGSLDVTTSNVVTMSNTAPQGYSNLPATFNRLILGRNSFGISELPGIDGVQMTMTYSLSRGTLSGVSTPDALPAITVPILASGSATPGVDFTYPEFVVIPQGQYSVGFDVTAIADNLSEGSEYFRLGILPAADYIALCPGYGDEVVIRDSALNLQVDSNNDGKIDWIDDSIEDSPNRPGKYIDIDNYDDDNDFIPGYADGFSINGKSADHNVDARNHFTPIQVTIPAGADLEFGSLVFTYGMSDPSEVDIPATEATHLSEPYDYKLSQNGNGGLRLWTKDGNVQRDASEFLSPTSPRPWRLHHVGRSDLPRRVGFYRHQTYHHALRRSGRPIECIVFYTAVDHGELQSNRERAGDQRYGQRHRRVQPRRLAGCAAGRCAV